MSLYGVETSRSAWTKRVAWRDMSTREEAMAAMSSILILYNGLEREGWDPYLEGWDSATSRGNPPLKRSLGPPTLKPPGPPSFEMSRLTNFGATRSMIVLELYREGVPQWSRIERQRGAPSTSSFRIHLSSSRSRRPVVRGRLVRRHRCTIAVTQPLGRVRCLWNPVGLKVCR